MIGVLRKFSRSQSVYGSGRNIAKAYHYYHHVDAVNPNIYDLPCHHLGGESSKQSSFLWRGRATRLQSSAACRALDIDNHSTTQIRRSTRQIPELPNGIYLPGTYAISIDSLPNYSLALLYHAFNLVRRANLQRCTSPAELGDNLPTFFKPNHTF